MNNIREKEEKEKIDNMAMAVSIVGLLMLLVYFGLIKDITDIIGYTIVVFIAIFFQVIWREKKK